MSNIYVVAKVLLVSQAGKVLTLRRSKTDARRPLEGDIPGGWVDEGEDFMAAAIRETEEETGIHLSPSDLQLVYTKTAYSDEKNTSWLFFIGRTDQAEVSLSPEHDQAEWLTLDAAIKAIPYKIQNEFLVYVRDNGLL